METTRNGLGIAVGIIFLIAVGFGIIGGIIYGYNALKVYSAWKSGEAEYAQAESNRRIKVLEAQAALDSASLTAQAEVKRAEGVSQANKIVADGLGGPEGYLRYLYIHMLEESKDKQVIYIPTEAGLPILEAGKRN